MALDWKFGVWLAAEWNIHTPSQLQAALIERIGVKLSVQALSTLMRKPPKAIRVQTIQAVCDAFGCRLSAFCEITPEWRPKRIVGSPTAKLYGDNEEPKERGRLYPNPAHYFLRDDRDFEGDEQQDK